MSRKGKTQAKAECWWCGGYGMSEEDVIPRWLRKLYPEPSWWRHVHAHPDLDREKVKRARGPRVISRKFCEACNNNWMSRLESAAMGDLSRMIKGEPIRLDTAAQRTLAFWVVKTTLAFESIEPASHRFADRELYRRVHERQGVPDGFQIWLCRREDGDVAWHRSHSLNFRDRAENGFGSTLSLGDFVAHLVWHRDTARQLKVASSMAGAVVQIWPIRKDARRWPPLMTIGGGPADLSWLAREFAARSELVVAQRPDTA